MRSVSKAVFLVFVISTVISIPLSFYLRSRSFGNVLGLATHLAHQHGCHRWHTCPSDSGSYICGDIPGHPCQYPTYSNDSAPKYGPKKTALSVAITPEPTIVPIATNIPVINSSSETDSEDSPIVKIAVVGIAVAISTYFANRKKNK